MDFDLLNGDGEFHNFSVLTTIVICEGDGESQKSYVKQDVFSN